MSCARLWFVQEADGWKFLLEFMICWLGPVLDHKRFNFTFGDLGRKLGQADLQPLAVFEVRDYDRGFHRRAISVPSEFCDEYRLRTGLG